MGARNYAAHGLRLARLLHELLSLGGTPHLPPHLKGVRDMEADEREKAMRKLFPLSASL